MRAQLGKILWYVSTVASRLKLSLNEIAEENIEYNAKRWAPRESQIVIEFPSEPAFDSNYDSSQQLPRKITIKFECLERHEGDTFIRRVQPYYEGKPAGNEIDDNFWTDDGYRFHDVMHMSYAAFLGWSPVLREILPPKFKRKEVARIDREQDGARARDTEEAITRLIHAWASRFNYFIGVGSIDTKLLELIHHITEGLEVHEKTFEQWERAILAGYRVRKQVIDNNGGFVTARLREKSLTFSTKEPS